ncbi:MICOS complex subunit MIC19 isoform X2 [Crotalus tigris]|uniref:MICOS complex subunit MIC19 isoform X2 n=1 Tax=Crotalus tigris TaxID=88082 RepID=UPI00192F996B|nr:MICOS complex subunit MIC19 isoform X2 [Crotalus tigris]
MGGGESVPRRVTFEADENDNITVVKGIRLSENVIERMKEPSSPDGRSQKKFGPGNHTSIAGAAVNEEELKKRIAEELALEEARRDAEAQKRLKQNQTSVQEEITKAFDRERVASSEQLARAILRERSAAEDERMKSQLLAKQLEGKEKELKKRETYYKEQLNHLEERSSQFYKVTTEQYEKAVKEVKSRFKRYKTDPVCVDLQNQIFQCYQQNPKETLSCSALAAEYFKCVQHARQCWSGRLISAAHGTPLPPLQFPTAGRMGRMVIPEGSSGP